MEGKKILKRSQRNKQLQKNQRIVKTPAYYEVAKSLAWALNHCKKQKKDPCS